MLFSSMTFLFVFLPITILFYIISPKALKNYVLLIASIIFYAWANIDYLYALILTILLNYFGALIIGKINDNQKLSSKLALSVTIIGNIGLIIYFKYLNFFIENINNIFDLQINIPDIILPIGISFYIFQSISYIIDVYRKECNVQKNILKLSLYICLFPQLIAGPIIKYHDIEEQIESRPINFEKINYGVKRFIIGLSKKMLIANTLGAIADKIFIQDPTHFSHSIAWLGSISYAFQLYFDFSGYSDMAIGLGFIFGFKFMENFNYPYISKSLTELWQRWHLSLGTWFKQYVYIPLGGNRINNIRTYINLSIIFVLLGLWHGANWTFIVWGITQGFFIVVERLLNIKEYDSKPHNLFVNLLRHIYFWVILLVSVVIFRSESISYALHYIMNMLGILKPNPEYFLHEFAYFVGKHEIIIFICAIIGSTPIFKNILDINNKYAKIGINLFLLTIFFLSVVTIAAETYNPFIYFRF